MGKGAARIHNEYALRFREGITMSSGGSGQSGVTEYRWNPFMTNMWGGGDIDPETGRPNPGLLNRGVTNVVNQPFQRYGGRRIAGFNPDQENAMAGTRYLARQGSDIGDMGSRATQNTLQGDFLNSITNRGIGTNQYAGDNPYFRDVMRSGMDDITSAYQRGTGADTTRMFNLSGAFGGSAHQNAVANNENALGRQLGNYAQGMQNQQYDRSANLREGDLQRTAGLYSGERDRMSRAGDQAINFENQGFNRFAQLMGIGNQQRGYDQSLLDREYGDWTDEQNWERNNLGWFANLLSQAQGGATSSTSYGGYGGNTNALGGLLGAAALGRGAGLY